MSLEGQDLARRCRDLADNKKAVDPVLLDLREVGGPSEFFLIVSGESEPHLKAIGTEIREMLRENLGLTAHADGFPASQWVVLDYNGVIIHIFQPDKRDFYDLESLWRDAPVVPFEDKSVPAR